VNAGLVQPEELERGRALDGDERVLLGGVAHLDPARLALLQPGVRSVAVAGVDDEEEGAVAEAVDDEVVDDPARLRRQERVLRAAVRDAIDVVREDGLEERLRRRPVDVELPHVRHVERARAGAHRDVLGDHALVLHRHLPAGERDHPCAERNVRVVEWRLPKRRAH